MDMILPDLVIQGLAGQLAVLPGDAAPSAGDEATGPSDLGADSVESAFEGGYNDDFEPNDMDTCGLDPETIGQLRGGPPRAA